MVHSPAADPRDPAVVQRIYQIRGDVRRGDARPSDGRCGNVTAALEREFGWPAQSGYLKLLDGTVSWVHCWNRLTDGTIVDATADQFQSLWLGDIVTLDPGEPLSASYRHAPRGWEFQFDRETMTGRVERIRCVSGDDWEILAPASAGRPWLSLARAVLEHLTGWDVNDALVDLAARTLRAKASTADQMSSADLTHVLLIAGIQHLGKQSATPWVAAEFRDPL